MVLDISNDDSLVRQDSVSEVPRLDVEVSMFEKLPRLHWWHHRRWQTGRVRFGRGGRIVVPLLLCDVPPALHAGPAHAVLL
ncbi:Hypp3130 [Branchiostoma lanceolatum]|uniref:Hypp3130 protein n=1 Tax=Branchiostoma lanceolatum TaxID=7740 RepID=A0A8J9ZX08_BRALA|nr:Hypp3130 [Branchiostoma lanceolatum]